MATIVCVYIRVYAGVYTRFYRFIRMRLSCNKLIMSVLCLKLIRR